MIVFLNKSVFSIHYIKLPAGSGEDARINKYVNQINHSILFFATFDSIISSSLDDTSSTFMLMVWIIHRNSQNNLSERLLGQTSPIQNLFSKKEKKKKWHKCIIVKIMTM